MRGKAAAERASGAAVFSAMALVVLDAGMVSVALPSIGLAFAETPARSMLVVGAYQLSLLAGLLPCAHLAERIGYRRLFRIGVALFGVSALLCALAPSLSLLVAARFVQGLGGAAIMSLGIALLRHALGPGGLPAAIAANALVVAVCSAMAPAAGAFLLSFASWRSLFAVAPPLAALALAATSALPPVKATSRSVDLLGAAIYAAAAACLFTAAQLVREAPPAAFGAAGAAVACAAWLLTRERRKQAPLVPLDLLALRPFRTSATASLFAFSGQSAGLLALPFYLQLSLGRSAATIALVLTLWPVAVAATSRVASRLADRVASGPLCAAGAILLAGGLAAMSLWPIGRSVAPLAVCAAICGTGFGLFQVPNNRTMFLTAPESRSAAAGGLQGTARLAGQTAGAFTVGFVLSAAPIGVAPRLAIGLAAIAALIAAWVSWRQHAPASPKVTRPHTKPLATTGDAGFSGPCKPLGSHQPRKVAERVGFEPTVPVKAQRFSRPPRSTAPAPLRMSPHGRGWSTGRAL